MNLREKFASFADHRSPRPYNIGTHLVRMLMARYAGIHQHMLVADGKAIEFYRKCGFERAGKTEPMWIYAGHEH